MNKIKIFFLCVLSCLLISCVGLKRGMEGNTYVSSAKPSFSIAVPALPLHEAGRINASINNSNALGGVSVDACIAVYGGENIDQAMAIISHASVKSPYYFDYNSKKFNSIDHSTISLGQFKFHASTYLITNALRDAFIPLIIDTLKSNTEHIPYFIVRRFTTRTDFERGKITLEYREKAPERFKNIQDLPLGAQEFLQEFNERAMQAFVFNQGASTQSVSTAYAKGISTRFLDEGFFGSISYHEPYD